MAVLGRISGETKVTEARTKHELLNKFNDNGLRKVFTQTEIDYIRLLVVLDFQQSQHREVDENIDDTEK